MDANEGNSSMEDLSECASDQKFLNKYDVPPPAPVKSYCGQQQVSSHQSHTNSETEPTIGSSSDTTTSVSSSVSHQSDHKPLNSPDIGSFIAFSIAPSIGMPTSFKRKTMDDVKNETADVTLELTNSKRIGFSASLDQCEDSRAEIVKLVKEITALKIEKAQLQHSESSLKDSNDCLEAELRKLKETLEKKDSQFLDISRMLSEKIEESIALQLSKQSLQDSFFAQKISLQNWKTESSRSKLESETLKVRMNAIVSELHAVSVHLEASKSKTLETDIERKMAEMTAELEACRERIRQLKSFDKNLQKSFDLKEQHLEDSDIQRETMKFEIIATKEEIAKLSAQLQQNRKGLETVSTSHGNRTTPASGLGGHADVRFVNPICFRCGLHGHYRNECTVGGINGNTVGGSFYSDEGNRSCLKCGHRGHINRDCPDARFGDDGFDRPYY